MAGHKDFAPAAIRLDRPLQHDDGYAWVATIDVEGDSTDISEYSSDLALFEDGIQLGPARSQHDQIRRHGRGRFSHWKRSVYFATSDNSNPNTNGRFYKVEVTERDPAEDRAQYGLKLVRQYASWLGFQKAEALPFRHKTLFELGPGPSMATAMAFAAFGGVVYVKERGGDLQWNTTFHGDTAERMLTILRRSGMLFDPEPLQRSLAQDAFDSERIVVMNDDRTAVSDRLAGKIDYVCSAAVLEHVDDLAGELSFLHKISKTSSKSAHFVDFRDHHNFDHPLEFLTLDDDEFLRSCEYRYSRGNRVRFDELKRIAESVGFQVEIIMGCRTDSLYLQDFILRLRSCSSRYKDTPVDWLHTLLAAVSLKKKLS